MTSTLYPCPPNFNMKLIKSTLDRASSISDRFKSVMGYVYQGCSMRYQELFDEMINTGNQKKEYIDKILQDSIVVLEVRVKWHEDESLGLDTMSIVYK